MGDVMCEHAFNHAGIRFADGASPVPGGGAVRRYYAHVYFCSRCLEIRGEPISGVFNSYDKIRFGATPGTADQCGVPAHDRGVY